MKWKLIVIFLLLGAALGGWWRWQNPGSGPAGSSAMISAINGPDLMTHVRSLNSPLVLVNFWASWCAPCKAEFPALLSIKEKWAARGLKVVFVSIDESPDLPAAEEFLRQSGVKFPTYHKGDQDPGFIRDIFPEWQGSVPTSLLIGPGGKLVDAWEGDSTPDELEARVANQMKGT